MTYEEMHDCLRNQIFDSLSSDVEITSDKTSDEGGFHFFSRIELRVIGR